MRLLAVDRDDGAMLLERVEPGDELHTLGDDTAQTRAIANLIGDLHRPYSGLFPFPHATDWINDALDRLAEVASEPYETLLLHGDLHHANVLAAGRAPWLAIDPKGVLGDPAWELAPSLQQAPALSRGRLAGDHPPPRRSDRRSAGAGPTARLRLERRPRDPSRLLVPA